jgi:hypothetical protein
MARTCTLWFPAPRKHPRATEAERAEAAVKLVAIVDLLLVSKAAKKAGEGLLLLLQDAHPMDCVEAVDTITWMLSREPNRARLAWRLRNVFLRFEGVVSPPVGLPRLLPPALPH